MTANKYLPNGTVVKEWQEISEERYFELLHALPPEKWEIGMFRMMEYTYANITLHVAKYRGRYYTTERQIISDYTPYHRELEKQIGKT